MQKSISARLAALEALEARQETPDGVLHVFVQLRPTDYRDLVSGDDQAAAWVCATYGLDTIGEHERACVSGGTWPMSLPPNGLTVASFDVGEGYGSRVDRWPMYVAAPEPGAWAWHIARGGDVEQMLRNI